MTKYVGEFVYFIQQGDDGPIKIGYSTDPGKRLKRLQHYSSRELKLLLVMSGDKDLEARLHSAFMNYCQRGEWFFPVYDITHFIEEGGNTKLIRHQPRIRHDHQIYCIYCGDTFEPERDDNGRPEIFTCGCRPFELDKVVELQYPED